MFSHRRQRRDAQPRAFARAARAALLALAFMSSALAGTAAANVNIQNIPNIDLGTWTPGMGPATVQEDFCVQSDIFGFFPLQWRAGLADLSGASTATQFRLASTGSSDLVTFTATLVDLRSGISEQLQDRVLTGFDKTGDFANCPNGLNARLEFTFDAPGLEGAGAGLYEGEFLFYAERFGNDTDRFRLRIRIPELVQISDLDDIPLGLYGGSGDMTGTDSVCVYRNDAAGAYEVQAFGQGASSAFVLEQATDSVPFEVEYDDGNGFASLSAGGAPVSAGNADTNSTACGGFGNATVRVTVRGAALANADAGAYSGTLTLSVAPI